MKKRFIYIAVIFTLLMPILFTGCSSKNEVQVGTSYNNKTGELSGKLKDIPAGKFVYVVVKLTKTLDSTTAGMKIYQGQGKDKKVVRQSSFHTHTEDKIIALPIKLDAPGSYDFTFDSRGKVLAEKTYKVVK